MVGKVAVNFLNYVLLFILFNFWNGKCQIFILRDLKEETPISGFFSFFQSTEQNRSWATRAVLSSFFFIVTVDFVSYIWLFILFKIFIGICNVISFVWALFSNKTNYNKSILCCIDDCKVTCACRSDVILHLAVLIERYVQTTGTEEGGPDRADRGAIGWDALPDSSAKEDRAVAADVPGVGRDASWSMAPARSMGTPWTRDNVRHASYLRPRATSTTKLGYVRQCKRDSMHVVL
jgi:hypothetical protein